MNSVILQQFCVVNYIIASGTVIDTNRLYFFIHHWLTLYTTINELEISVHGASVYKISGIYHRIFEMNFVLDHHQLLVSRYNYRSSLDSWNHVRVSIDFFCILMAQLLLLELSKPASVRNSVFGASARYQLYWFDLSPAWMLETLLTFRCRLVRCCCELLLDVETRRVMPWTMPVPDSAFIPWTLLFALTTSWQMPMLIVPLIPWSFHLAVASPIAYPVPSSISKPLPCLVPLLAAWNMMLALRLWC